MPYPPHSVKVETQVVDSVQDLGQHFVGCVKMTQIGARIALADAAATIWVERTAILGVAGLFDRHFALRSEQQAVARGAGGKDAIHHVDTQVGVFDDFLGSATGHEIARLVFGKVLKGGFDNLAREFAGLSNAETADRVAGESDFDGAEGGFAAECAVHSALDDAEEGLGAPRLCGDGRPRLSGGARPRSLSTQTTASAGPRRALLDRTAEGGCPYMCIAPGNFVFVIFEVFFAA